jgi:GNAT superfamily N-acetyltransferase
MPWTLARDVEQWLAEAGAFLRSRPAAHTILLTVSDTLRAQGPHFFGDGAPRFGCWRSPSGVVAGALLHTPPRPVHVSPLSPEAVTPLAELLAEPSRPRAAGVDLELSAVAPFLTAWQEQTGSGAKTGTRTRLYRLGQLTPPTPPPAGRPRPATVEDRQVVGEWLDGMAREAGVAADPQRRRLDEWLARDALTLWEHEGTPVSMAAASQCLAGSARISAVYTPPAHRRPGYAAAVTAEASRRARDGGAAEVVLFTDLANPTSNAVYQRIGYQPVLDRAELRFEEARPAVRP